MTTAIKNRKLQTITCPVCKMSFIPKNVCKRCDWEWQQRGSKKPTVCPKCKSPYWNDKKLTNNKHVQRKPKSK